MKKRRFICLFLILPLIIILFSLSISEGKKKTTTLSALLIIGDNYLDPKFNEGSKKRKENLQRVNAFLNYLGKKRVVKIKKKVLRGKNVTVKEILDNIKKLSVKKNGIFLVYFSGHGGWYKKEQKTFVYTYEGDVLLRSELQREVYRKNGRLKLIITDNGSKEVELPISVTTGVPKSEKARIKAYRNLLYNFKGLLHITAATEGEDAHPSFFTKSVFDTLMDDPKSTWEENFAIAKRKTVSLAKSLGKKQTPKFFLLRFGPP